LLEIGAGAALFEFLVVEDEALDEVVAELLRGPDTEPGAPVRLHPIADRDDDIEGVEFDFPGDLALNCCKKCNSCFPLQFTFVEDVLDVAGDDGLIPLEQLRHLASGEPDGLVDVTDVDACLPVLGLEEDGFLPFFLPTDGVANVEVKEIPQVKALVRPAGGDLGMGRCQVERSAEVSV